MNENVLHRQLIDSGVIAMSPENYGHSKVPYLDFVIFVSPWVAAAVILRDLDGG